MPRTSSLTLAAVLLSHACVPRPQQTPAPPLQQLNGAALPPGAAGGTFLESTRVIIDVYATGRAARPVVATLDDAGQLTPIADLLPAFPYWHAGAQPSPDGRLLYFESPHRPQHEAGREDTDLWVAARLGGGWGPPRPVGAPFDTPHNEHNVTISARGTLCINSSRPGVTQGHDILCARRASNGWGPVEKLDDAVNGTAREVAPFIDPRERFLLFASNRAGGAGDFDLYVSHRGANGWLPAVRLRGDVNTADSESNPSVSPDGRILLFSRSSGGRVTLHRVAVAKVLP